MGRADALRDVSLAWVLEALRNGAALNFDYLQAHPELARLGLWEGLADIGAVPDVAARSALYQRKLDVIAEAQRNGLIDDTLEPAYLATPPSAP